MLEQPTKADLEKAHLILSEFGLLIGPAGAMSDHTVTEIVLLDITAHVLERQHRDGRSVRQFQVGRGLAALPWFSSTR